MSLILVLGALVSISRLRRLLCACSLLAGFASVCCSVFSSVWAARAGLLKSLSCHSLLNRVWVRVCATAVVAFYYNHGVYGSPLTNRNHRRLVRLRSDRRKILEKRVASCRRVGLVSAVAHDRTLRSPVEAFRRAAMAQSQSRRVCLRSVTAARRIVARGGRE